MNTAKNLWLTLTLCFFLCGQGSSFKDEMSDRCEDSEYHFVLTECDNENGRWRVKVPNTEECRGEALYDPPIRIRDCEKSCDPGYYFNLDKLVCTECPPGTFSLGGGVLFESWDKFPSGFHAEVESLHSSFTSIGRLSNNVNCTRFGWQHHKDFIASFGGPCAATLTYTVHLVKPGNLTYVYQYSDKDIIFDFEVQNEQCHFIGDSNENRWPSYTQEGEWMQQTVELKLGQNVLRWKTIGMDLHQGKPVLINKIEITGVDYTSSCVPCRAGTYSNGGSRQCTECPENHYSTQESSSCSPCNNITHYAPKGSSSCLPKAVCSTSDYYARRTPCDHNNQTQHVYEWLQPKICRDDSPNAVKLPMASSKQACPPCNPGMEYYQNRSECDFCPPETFSDGKSPCRKCPPNTIPNYSYQFQFWNEIHRAISYTCMEPDGSSCSNTLSWRAAGSHIESSRRHSPTAYLLLSLKVPGFRLSGGVSNGRHLEVGRVTFSFELDCHGKCEFVFMQDSERKGVVLVQSWIGSTTTEEFTHIIQRNDSYTFTWAFQKQQLGQNMPQMVDKYAQTSYQVDDNYAKIFNITVSNTILGGARMCTPCHQEEDDENHEQGCIPCSPGYYIEPNSTACVHCPENTTVTDPFAFDKESCEPCGSGLTSSNGITCTTTCIFDFDGVIYDLRPLARPYLVKGNRLFTASGAQYNHVFNISLCGQEMVICSNNVTYQIQDRSREVKSFVCRSTVVPSQWTDNDVAFVTQSVTLGDELISVTKNTTYLDLRVIEEFINTENLDIHFYYSTPMTTRSCPQGRSTVVTLRCDPLQAASGSVILPSKCPDGTCDGCNFNFLWKSAVACPICTEKQYRLVKGECLDGMQAIHYLPPTNCIMPKSMSNENYMACTTAIPSILKFVISASVTLLIFLCGLMLHFWRKTQNLEYKYMKLVQSSGNRDVGEAEGDGALVHAESCALDDGEEEEIQFSQARGTGFISRIRAITSKIETGNPFETIQLKS